MPNITVLGGGMVGGYIARRLAALDGLQVTLADRDARVLSANQARAKLNTNQADLSDTDVILKVIEDAELVVGAVPGFLGFEMLRTVIETGRPIVDISFFPEDALELHELARERGSVAVVDCGVMPGVGGMMTLSIVEELRASGVDVQSAGIYVGGLPVERRWPLEYKAPFSPVDVIEEYVRPARVREQGQIVIYPALSGIEPMEFDGIGTLEAFNSDGLRTLLQTVDVPTLTEKTLRYPGHANTMRMLRELGFFEANHVRLPGGREVAPLEVTTRLLDRVWRLEDGEQEFTVMRVEVRGMQDGSSIVQRWELLDRTSGQDSSMARTTGLPAIAAIKLILSGSWVRPGVSPPELLATDPHALAAVLAELDAAGVQMRSEGP